MFLIRLTHALERHQIQYALVGGFAVALHGAVRGTVDVDLVLCLNQKNFVSAEKVFKEIGLEPRLPVNADQVFQFRNEYIQNRNLVAWSFFNPSHPLESVDVIITHDASKMKIEKVRAFNTILRVASIDDLIAMKKQSGREQDLADIEALKKISERK